MNTAPSATNERGRLKPLPLDQSLISLLGLGAEADNDTIIAAVKKLKDSASRPHVVMTEREKKIRARMDKGNITYTAAALAVDQQEREDQRRASINRK